MIAQIFGGLIVLLIIGGLVVALGGWRGLVAFGVTCLVMWLFMYGVALIIFGRFINPFNVF
jgi:hypothetical protein